ncbi:hypothetical protein DMI70_24175 [Escherichia coli]|nr:hypothetical protein [Escherichia coli]
MVQFHDKWHLLRLVKRENQIKFDCGGTGANYTHLCAAGEGKFRGNSNNMQKPRKKHGSEYFALKYDE